MKVYKCPRCGHVTDKISNYKAHLNKKFTCKDKNNCGKTPEEILNNLDSNNLNICEYKCCGCLEKFDTNDIITQHKTTCRSYELFMKLQEKDEKIKEKDEKINILESLLLKVNNTNLIGINDINGNNINGNNNNININNINQTINQNINIVLHNFGEEDISHITSEYLDKCLLSISKGIPSVVEKIYYDELKKENKTVVIKSSKNEQVKIYKNGIWTICPYHEILPEMVKKGGLLLYDHYLYSPSTEKIRETDRHENEMSKFNHITDITSGDKNKKNYRECTKSVKSIIQNHR